MEDQETEQMSRGEQARKRGKKTHHLCDGTNYPRLDLAAEQVRAMYPTWHGCSAAAAEVAHCRRLQAQVVATAVVAVYFR